MKPEYKNAVLNRKKICHSYLNMQSCKKNFTVTDVTNDANLNRSTFYLHFKNLEDVKKHIEDELTNNFKELERSFRKVEIDKTPEIIFNKLNEIILKDIKLYRLIIKAQGEYTLISKMKSYILNAISNNFMIMRYVTNYENFKTIVQYIVSGAIDTYMDWFKGNIDCTLEELSDLLCRMIKGGLKGYLNYGY